VGIEPVALGRFVRAVNAIAVALARSDVGDVAVIDLIGVFGQLDALGFLAGFVFEEANFDLRRVR
jgi:hypothetical protein